jgi:prepilin-type N-terminal cleavage/methylation domain-containing protein
MSKTRKHIQNDNGFTLVELMVTVFLTAIAVISIYRGYTSFSQAADAQQQVMEMQQNLRIGMTKLVTDIRRAGMNEDGEDVAGFIAADATSVAFSMDIGSGGVFATDAFDNDDDGETNEEDESRIGDVDVCDEGEQISYALNGGNLEKRVRDTTLPCPPPGQFEVTPQIIITNVEALNFVYFDDTNAITTDLEKVDRVEITLVVRTTNEDYRYTNRETYFNLQDEQVWPPPPPATPPDNFRRRSFTMSVQIRNNI